MEKSQREKVEGLDIIRCKDCQFARLHNPNIGVLECGLFTDRANGFEEKVQITMCYDDFCSYGKKKK